MICLSVAVKVKKKKRSLFLNSIYGIESAQYPWQYWFPGSICLQLSQIKLVWCDQSCSVCFFPLLCQFPVYVLQDQICGYTGAASSIPPLCCQVILSRADTTLMAIFENRRGTYSQFSTRVTLFFTWQLKCVMSPTCWGNLQEKNGLSRKE